MRFSIHKKYFGGLVRYSALTGVLGLTPLTSSQTINHVVVDDHVVQQVADCAKDAMATIVIDARTSTPTYWLALRREKLIGIDDLIGVPQNPTVQLSLKPTVNLSPGRPIRIFLIEYATGTDLKKEALVGPTSSQIKQSNDWSVFVRTAASTDSNTASSILDSQFYQETVLVNSPGDEEAHIIENGKAIYIKHLVPNKESGTGKAIRILEVKKKFDINALGNFQIAAVNPSLGNASGATETVTTAAANVDKDLVYDNSQAISDAQSRIISVNEATQYSMANAFQPSLAFVQHKKFALALDTVDYSFTPSFHIDTLALINAGASSTGGSTTNAAIGEGLSFSTWLGNPYQESGKKFFGFPLRLTGTIGVSMFSFSKGDLGNGVPFIAVGIQIPIGNSGAADGGSAKNKGSNSGS